MNVMRNDEKVIGCCRVTCVSIFKVILRVLDQQRRAIVVVISVDVEIYNVVSQCVQGGLATRCDCAVTVGWTHVGWEETQDISESHLFLDDLVLTLLWVDGG